MKTISSFIIPAIFSFSFLAHAEKGNWANSGILSKRFIENKGQFASANPSSGGFDGYNSRSGSEILYGIDWGKTKIFFTKQGLTYRFDDPIKNKERKEGSTEPKFFPNSDLVHLVWENANPNVELIAEEQSDDYFSYSNAKGENINYIKGYKKLIYKNLYPNIDAVYEFPSPSPTLPFGESRWLSGLGGAGGIKYSLILHPGADISQIKMKYESVENIFIDDEGNIHLPTKFGDIIDHAPKSFYESESHAELVSASIESHFLLNGKVISFFLGNYDKAKTVIIDPWVQTPTLPNSNGVWECEHDGAGNVYIIGGCMPMKLLKYNSAGALQWTYTTPWDTANNWLGTLATDFNGNSYVTSGSIAAMQKVNTGAGLVWSVNGGSMDEYWNISFNCDQTKLVVGGTRLVFNAMLQLIGYGAIFDINTSNGNVNNVQYVGGTFNFILATYAEEVRAMSSSYNSRYYYLTHDTIGCIDQNFSCSSPAPIFAINSGYAFAYKSENYRPNNGNSGIMAIRADKNFVYTQNGVNIEKRSLTNGTVLGTAAIPGGISTATLGRNQPGNSGIDIDTCGNVYVGSGNAVIKYDANLNQLSSVALPYAVYDVSVSTNGDVIVCGTTGTSSSVSRTGYVQSIASFAACNPLSLQCCNANICNAGPFCLTDPPQTLSASTPGGTWSGTGITNPTTGVFDPSVSGTGTFVITYTLPCGSGTTTIVVNNCALPVVCIEPNGDLTVSGGAGPTYSWQVQSTTQDCSQCLIPALCQPPAANCPIIITTWTTFSNSTTITPPGTWPIQVIDASGNTVVINSTAGLPPCSTIVTLNASQVNVLCNGQCTGSASVTASGGSSPYTYSWSSGQSTSAVTGLCAGTYSVLVTDAIGTTSTSFITITQPATALTATATATSPSCAGGGSASASASGGTASYTFQWNPGGQTTSSVSGLTPGNYTATVTDANGCTATATVSISSASGGTVTVTSSSSILCNGGTTTITAVMNGGTSPFTYNWSGGQSTSSITVGAGSYSVTVTDASGCTSIDTISITEPAALTNSVSVTNTTCGSNTGSASVTVSGGTPSYTYNWSSGQSTSAITGLSAGIYTCTITDANGCTQTATANILNTNAPQPTVTATDATCYGGNDGSASVSVTGGTPPYTYLWNPTGQTTTTATGLSAGTYTVIVSDATGCSNMQTAIVSQPPPSVTAIVTASPVTITTGGTTQLNASGGTAYSWVPSTGLSNPNISNPVASLSQTTKYCVYVIDTLTSCADTACITVFVEAPCGTYYFPNAFSPNGDDENDVLKVYGVAPNCVIEYQLLIYNRWGEKVFSSTDPTETWDGVYKGKAMGTQVLTYYLQIIFTDGKENEKKTGNVSLVK